MFFWKKKSPVEPVKQGIKTMDTVVTGVILGSIIASLYGVKKLREKNKEDASNHTDDHPSHH
jgi:hypothetical protein